MRQFVEWLRIRGRHLIARETGHHIPIEAPRMVADAIREMLAAGRR